MTKTDGRFGLSVALATPMTASGAIDFPRLVQHARRCIDGGCNSVTLFGTTGEGASVGIAGRLMAYGALKGAGFDFRKQVLSGVAASSVHEAMDQCRVAYDADCRGILLAPSFYFKGQDDDGVYGWFAKLFDALGSSARDMILYHIPSVTGVAVSPAVIARLRKSHPGVVIGVKDSSGEKANTETLLAEHGDLAILVGDERQLANAVRKGAQGTICGVANICPELLVPVVAEGRDDPRLNAVVDALVAYPVIPAVKALIGHVTGDAAWRNVRSPLMPIGDADMAALGAAYDRARGAKAA
ncbi:dihydrodipicolinate synthase family protein [uncultured Alsobacter sp.]|uniref:dihydrodipicolinate synthase family protein n=1 Tax=uncultured Alsobacter sp. TaxID=1748258 RepID=UPI0025FFC72F|nr:dihydrodipicolinate synthase family protein [uncultured Alsobacter sp.]